MSQVSDVFSDMIRQRLREGYQPRSPRPWRRRLDRAGSALIACGVVLWAAGSIMAAAAALWHLAGQ